jgi:DNA repair photolyase
MPDSQIPLDDLFAEPQRRTSLGHAAIAYHPASSILTAASGFMDTYDYTLNPYAGCSFGCTYCYAAFFVRDAQKQAQWGTWVQVKENAVQLLQKYRRKPLMNKTIYMSSVTDPYQPIERELAVTRALLEELVAYHQVHLVVQTRSPLVTRDIDLFQRFARVQVNMTITTDDEVVRKVFEPHCSSIAARLAAITRIREAGIATCITMTPLLPIQDAARFADRLVATGVPTFIVQPFHPERGKFIAGTREEAMQLCTRMHWNLERYRDVLQVLKRALPQLGEGKDGFAPPSKNHAPTS